MIARGLALLAFSGTVLFFTVSHVAQNKERRLAALRLQAETFYRDASRGKPPASALPSCWEEFQAASRVHGKLASYKVKEVYIPLHGFPETVMIETERRGKIREEMLASLGSKFNDFQMVEE